MKCEHRHLGMDRGAGFGDTNHNGLSGQFNSYPYK